MDLVQTLTACANAVQDNNHDMAEFLFAQIDMLMGAVESASMRKAAMYFVDALAMRIRRVNMPPLLQPELLENHFYKACPYLQIGHLSANHAILETFTGSSRFHVVDFGLKPGMQWPSLLQALAHRTNEPIHFKLTSVGPPRSENCDTLERMRSNLYIAAAKVGLSFEFQYRGVTVNSLANIHPSMLGIFPGDLVAVNSVFELHKWLSRRGDVEKVLAWIRTLNPRVVTLVEQEANHNGSFMERFTEALSYYSAMLGSVESSGLSNGATKEDVLNTEGAYLRRQIYNLVACEGVERVERHETLSKWRRRMGSAGFAPVHLTSTAFEEVFGYFRARWRWHNGGHENQEYGLHCNDGCLILEWLSRPMIATSAWRLA